MIIGIVVPSVLLLGGIIGGMWYIWRLKKSVEKVHNEEEYEDGTTAVKSKNIAKKGLLDKDSGGGITSTTRKSLSNKGGPPEEGVEYG